MTQHARHNMAQLLRSLETEQPILPEEQDSEAEVEGYLKWVGKLYRKNPSEAM